MVTIDTTEDTSINTYFPNTNYGSEVWLETDNDAVFTEAIYLQFPLIRKPIKIASLYMYCIEKETNASQLKTNPTTEMFVEEDPTWNSQVSINSQLDNTFDIIVDTWSNTAISTFANSTVRDEYVGIAIQSPTYAADHNGSAFHSKEYNSGSHAPYIDVTYYAQDEVAYIQQGLEVHEEWTWWGIIHLDSIDCIGDLECNADVTTPWGGTVTDYTFADGGAYTWNNGTDEHYMIVPHIFCSSQVVVFETYWWFGNASLYVKTGGSDSANGLTWASAFETITKGAQTIPDGGKLYIEEGTYTGETQIEPSVDNAEYITQPSSHTEAACTVTVTLA